MRGVMFITSHFIQADLLTNSMVKRMYKVSSLVVALLTVIGVDCTAQKNVTNSAMPSLKQVFRQAFLVGAAVNTRQIEGKDTAAGRLINTQFNAVTPENIMKGALVHPGWDNYDFSAADSLVAFAERNQLKVNAHNLIWHSQLPAFMRNMQDADSVREYFVNHIKTVASRYDGKVYSWDVVNEALNEDGTLRKSVFQQKLGDDYVVEAFRLAQSVTPHSRLYYNDYNIEQPAKRAGAIALVKQIQAAGVRIDGIGIQGHWHLNHLPLKDIEESIKEFSSLGIEVMFTELDISVLPEPGSVAGADVNQQAGYATSLNPYVNGLPDSIQMRLADAYSDLFSLFLKYKGKVTRVTFWGVDDGQSWLNNWPVRGRTNYPLLFDRNHQPKPAFYSVLKTQ